MPLNFSREEIRRKGKPTAAGIGAKSEPNGGQVLDGGREERIVVPVAPKDRAAGFFFFAIICVKIIARDQGKGDRTMVFPVLAEIDGTAVFMIIVLIALAFFITFGALDISGKSWNRVNLPLFIIGATMFLASFIVGESTKGSSMPLVNAATLGGFIVGLILIFAIILHAVAQTFKEDQRREKEMQQWERDRERARQQMAIRAEQLDIWANGLHDYLRRGGRPKTPDERNSRQS